MIGYIRTAIYTWCSIWRLQ